MADSNEIDDIEHFRELLLHLRAEILALQGARDDLAATFTPGASRPVDQASRQSGQA